MALKYKLDTRGGFTVGDTETMLTSYAYPTSPWAHEARKEPRKIAKAMIDEQQWRKPVNFVGSPFVRDYDKRNWQTIDS